MTDHMPDPDLPITVVNLSVQIEAAWTSLDAAIDGLDDHQLSTPAADGGWSIKDHLAHLATWIVSANAILTGRNRADAMGVGQSTWANHDEDAVNAEIIDRWSGQPATAVLAALHTAQAELRMTIHALSDDDLLRPYASFQPDAPEVTDPVRGWIAGNTFGHVEMHLPQIERLRAAVT